MDFNTNNKKVLLYSIIGLLVALNVFLFFFTRKANNESQELRIEKIKVQDERDNLRISYDRAITSIEKFKGENVDLDNLSKEQKSKIDKLNKEIKTLLNKKNITDAELRQAQILIRNLELQATNFTVELTQLKNDNLRLTESNTQLTVNLENEEAKTEQLTFAKEVLETEKEELITKTNVLTDLKDKLSAENSNLTEEKQMFKNLASLLAAENIEANGVLSKKSGKEKQTKRTKKLDKIKVCYDILINPVAEAGNKDLLLRIQHPEGFTLAVESLGSGVFTSYETKESMQYTTSARINYNNDKVNRYCTYCDYNAPLSKGNYIAEIYQYGMLIGSKGFKLK